MSICSSIYITKEEALKQAKSVLMRQQESLVDNALKSMEDYELGLLLSTELYDYNIVTDEENEDEQ